MSEAIYIEEIKITGAKLTSVLPQLEVIAKANNLRLNRGKEYKKATRILIKSIYFN